MGLDIKMAVSQIHTDCFIEINTYTYMMFRLHKFDSQLQCTVELNNSVERLALRKVHSGIASMQPEMQHTGIHRYCGTVITCIWTLTRLTTTLGTR